MRRTSIFGLNLTWSEILRLFVILAVVPWIVAGAVVWLAMRAGLAETPPNVYAWALILLAATGAMTGIVQAVADGRTLLGRPIEDDDRRRLWDEIRWAEIRTEQSLLQSDLQQKLVIGQTAQTQIQTALKDEVSRLADHFIQAGERPKGIFHDVPPFPPHFLGRDQIVADLVARLTAGGTVALSAEGLPGVGKTTLAVALAHHRAILDHFTDGVLWAGLGTQPDLLGILAGWGDALGVDVTDRPTPEGRAGAVRNASASAACSW